MTGAVLLTMDWMLNLPISPILLILVLVFLGELLLGLEFFVIPGFGAGGIMGGVSLLAAAFIAAFYYGVLWGVAVFLLSAMLSFAGLLFGMKTKMIQKRFVLGTVQKHGQGTGVAALTELVGKSGVSMTALRPAGIAMVDGKRLDVVSAGAFVDNGRPVEVILVEGPRIVVKEVKQQP